MSLGTLIMLQWLIRMTDKWTHLIWLML